MGCNRKCNWGGSLYIYLPQTFDGIMKSRYSSSFRRPFARKIRFAALPLALTSVSCVAPNVFLLLFIYLPFLVCLPLPLSSFCRMRWWWGGRGTLRFLFCRFFPPYSDLFVFLSFFLSVFLSFFLSFFLFTHLPFFLSAIISIYLFCLDEIPFRRDYKSCRIGVVVVVDDVPHLWKLCDGITFVILELHFWDLVHCLLISFCFGSEILKKIGPPQPPKKPKNPPKKTWIFSMG